MPQGGCQQEFCRRVLPRSLRFCNIASATFVLIAQFIRHFCTAQAVDHACNQGIKGFMQGLTARDQHRVFALACLWKLGKSNSFAQATLDAVALNRIADLLGDCVPNPQMIGRGYC